MTIWIGCDDLDRLLTYPDARYLSRCALPIRMRVRCDATNVVTPPLIAFRLEVCASVAGFVHVAMLQTSSNHPVFQGGLALVVTNVVNPSPKSAFSGVLARGLTTFVTCGVEDALKMLRIDDVCNNSRVRQPCEGFYEFCFGELNTLSRG